MNILYFHPHFTYPGGAGKFVLETGERLAKMGHSVTVLAQSGDEAIIGDYPNIEFKFIGGPLPNTMSHWLQFPILMKRIFEATKGMDIDIIFPQAFPANYWGFLFKRKNPDIPCIWYCHDLGSFIYQKDLIMGLKNPIKTMAIAANPFVKKIDKQLIKNVDAIVTNSHFTSKFIHNTYALTSKVIYPGVDINKFKPLNEKENIVFNASRLYKFKKVDILIKAMSSIKNAQLYIAGDGEEKDNLVNLTNELGITDKVFFTGNLNDEQLNNYYSKAKVVVFPAENEAFGIAQLEAMAAGTPAISTRSGGVVETILDNETGFLVESNNIDEISTKIKEILDDDELCISMAKKARIHVENNFTWDIAAKRLDEFFLQIGG
ncbi:glycosyltransferase family 4 protein [Methanohalophilus sp. WG1-DM]|uniref:glycosyltransferase family 4 protein n=1 Tax=Methanohalophilus sp. WG1-DM TaxID=2491675 RepID=UPI000FFF4DB5|nr:glycosyltransferase family 4 protein [Methanohalophilus sp. WG1-DM]RXG33524.1 glycosyl transferase group 1 [Methanohalophilus sp. WG1-DM]